MEKLYREGIVKAIGVSNFSPERIVDLCMNHEIKPAVNQIEIHPFYQQEEALRVMRSYDIVPEAWGPFWDFELTQKDMKEIEAMDIGHSEIIDHRCFCTARQLNSIKIHD